MNKPIVNERDLKHERMIDECWNGEVEMTDWEIDFTFSVQERLEGEQSLTEKQADTLDEIWYKVT